MQKIIPARLRPGDEIRVIAPASGIKIIGRECREIARRRFEEMGLAVSYGTNAVDENWDAGASASGAIFSKRPSLIKTSTRRFWCKTFLIKIDIGKS